MKTSASRGSLGCQTPPPISFNLKLPNTPSHFIRSQNMASQRDRRVSWVMNATISYWDEQEIQSVFSRYEVKHILSIHLSIKHKKDEWQWTRDKRGSFSVFKGYKTLRKTRHPSYFSLLSIWPLPIPPKVYGEPVNLFYLTKKSFNIGECGCCNSAEEDTLHSLLRCSARADELSLTKVDDLLSKYLAFKEWWGALCQKKKRDEKSRIVMLF